MNVDEKKSFKNLDEDFNDDFENDFENANFINTKFVNLHIIFFLDLILNCFANKYFKIKNDSFFLRF
jgi:hypothetical protein